MIERVLWTCFQCYGTKQSSVDTSAAAVDTPSCCDRPMWMTGVIRDAASSEEKP